MKKFSAIVKVFLISILLSVNCFADDFLRRATDENSYISGEYQLFSKRGSPANVESKFSISPSYPIRAGNISVDHQGFKGYVRHTSEFGGHGWQVHSPFSNSSSLHLDDLSGSIIVGGSSHNKLTVSGLESHHGEDYDGPQGGGFPEPTGARDHYSYGISGTVVTVKVVSLERVNNALPDDRKLTEREIKLLQNGGEISEQRKRELTAIVEKSNPTEVPWNALPEPVSAQLGKEDVALASDGTNLFWKSIVDGAKFTAGVAIAAGATIAETAEGTWNAVTNPISTIAGVGNTLAEGLWVVGESSYGLYKSDNKIDYFYDGTVENLNALSAKISDKIEDTKANAAACGDDYICKGAIYGKPATDTASYVIGGVGTAKTLGTVEKTVQNSADNFAGEVGKNIGKVENTATNTAKIPDNLFPDTNIPLLEAPNRSNPWAEGVPIVSMEAPKNFYINMAREEGQDWVGGWGTQDYIPDVNYVRNELAVTPAFKSNVSDVQTYLIPEGIRIQTGTVGPQTHNGVTYPGRRHTGRNLSLRR